MPWHQLHIEAKTSEETDLFEALLLWHGASSISFKDAKDTPIYEPLPNTTPLWPEILIEGLFESQSQRDHALQEIKAQFPSHPISAQTLEDKVWERVWMDSFHPIPFGQKLWVVPTHHTPPVPEAVNILLDPGLAFGTGTHETTALCLEYLDGLSLEGKTVCDYGCGSGILAIAALKLGATHAYATDIDKQAIIATHNNAKRNGINTEQLTVEMPDTFNAPEVDVVVANILAAPIIELKTRLINLVKPGGILILSGILAYQKQSVLDAYEPLIHCINQAEKSNWQRLVFEK